MQGSFNMAGGQRNNSSVELLPKALLNGQDTRTEIGSQSLDQSETQRLPSKRNASHVKLSIHDKDITGNISTQKTISLLPKSTNHTLMLGPVSRKELISQIIVDERFQNNDATVYPHTIRDLSKLNAVTPNFDNRTDGANVIDKLTNKALSKAYSENKSNEAKSLMLNIPATKIEANIADEIEKEIHEIFGNSYQSMWTKKTGR